MLKLMPMNIYDVAAQQARMEDQAARGWFAVSVPGIFFLAVFEKGEPKAHATVGNLHRITLRRYGGPQIAAL